MSNPQTLFGRITYDLAKLPAYNVGGTMWPADAVFAVKYNMHTWPLGWGKEANVAFFPTLEALDAWKAAKHAWADYEDNHVAYIVYEWDRGAKPRDDLSYDPGNVGTTYEEQRTPR